MASPSAGRGQTREERLTYEVAVARRVALLPPTSVGASNSLHFLADAVEELRSRLAAAEAAIQRVSDLCAEHEASNDEFDGFQDVDVDTRLVRAALYGASG